MMGMMRTILRLIWLIIYKYESSSPMPFSENVLSYAVNAMGYILML
jgi:hypothetical protein